MYETAAEKTEILKGIFVSKSSLSDGGSNPPLLPEYAYNSLNTIKICTKVDEKKLKQLKRFKATGPDGIPVRVLKEYAVILCRPLTHLFTLSLGQGIVPNEWKCAHVIPCYKSGGKANHNNNHPIFLLFVISKVLESIINDKLRRHMFGLNLISSNQFGFRPNHSTLDLLMSTTQKWSNALADGRKRCCS